MTTPAPAARTAATIDQVTALAAAADHLHREFADTFTTVVIDRFLHSSYDELAARATVVNYLPLLAERFARQRLRALAKLEGHPGTGTPAVLFLCTHNAARSQMALGFFTHFAGHRATGWSGGTTPIDRIEPAVIDAMAEAGIDITGEFPKPWTEEIVRAADVVISMGCGDACPTVSGGRCEEWDLPDPTGADPATVREIRDDIEERVRALVADLDGIWGPVTRKVALSGI
ncbi:arsenate reductase ArsC [Nocardia vermiculata]|uniref:Arsenate reductase ArsC n=1 Tax=Nocardia vermiculata TaxID=257274 RepID=A0A846Y326_9NOCA|nr:arsenate reductase ArsC [Nocardia vermiculata]NKY53916.1 arsenate reductase ArsC [Nocardia vermiculata]